MSYRTRTLEQLPRTFIWRDVARGVGAGAAALLMLLPPPALAQQDVRIVEKPALVPSELSVNQPTSVLVTARVAPSPSLIPTSVTLVRYDESGKAVGTIGRMYDNGTNGDQIVGDGVYSLRIQLYEANPQAALFRVSVAYKGTLTRKLSDPGTVFVQSTVTPEQVLATIANAVATGDVETAVRYFSGSSKNRDVIANLDPDQRLALASAFQQARLVRSAPNMRVYVAPLTVDGAVLQRELSMSRTMLNEWYVMSW